MDDTKTTNTANKFTKTRHRPWEKNLLEDKISQSSSANIESSLAADLDHNYARQRQVTEKHDTEAKEQADLIDKIVNIDDEPILIGGIFRPHQFVCAQTDNRREEVGTLIDRFQRKNSQLQSLTHELKVLEAQETAQKAEQAKAGEERLRKASEAKIQEVMNQLTDATRELHNALQRAQENDVKAKKEISLRKEVQIALEESRLKNEGLEKQVLDLENSNTDLEAKSKQTIEKVIQIETASQTVESDLKGHIEQLKNEIRDYQSELEQIVIERDSHEAHSKKVIEQRDEYQRIINQKEKELLDYTRSGNERVNNLKERIEEQDAIVVAAQKEKQVLSDNIEELRMTNSNLTTESEKLKEILTMERQLRQDAEAKAILAQEKASTAEQERVLAQKKAQAAIKRANQTVMKFISQDEDEDNLSVTG